MRKLFTLFSQYRGLRREAYVLFFGRMVTNFGAMIWPVLTLILNQKLGFDATTVALIMGGAGLLQLPLGLLGGKLADKYNKRNIIIVCDIVSVILYMTCAFIPLSMVTIGCIIVASSFQKMEHPAYLALLADLTGTKNREKAYSLLYLGANIGLVASPTIAGLLFAHYLWLSFLICAIAIGSSTILIFTMIKDVTPVDNDLEGDIYQQRRNDISIAGILKENIPVVLYLAAMAFYHGAYMQYAYLMPLDMAKVHGDAGAVLYGSVSSTNCIIVVLFTPILTQLFSGKSYTWKNLLGNVMVLIGYLVFLLGLGYIPTYYLAILFFTWGEILVTIVHGPYLTARLPASHRGRINGVSEAVQTISTNAAMVLVGMLYDDHGSTSAWIFVMGIVFAGIICSALLMHSDRKRYENLYQ